MIELRLIPRLLIMAGLAFFSLLPFVLVIVLVARVAIGLQLILVQVFLMATGTLCRGTVFAEQGKFGLLVVIEQNFLPAFFQMTGLAFRPETSLVFVILGMA